MISRLTARTIALLVGAALLLGLIAFALHQWNSSRTAKTQSRVDKGQAEAATSAGAEALNTMGAVFDKSNETDRKVQEGRDAIDQAEPGNSNDAADRATCELRLYRHTERCRRMREVHPGAVASPSTSR